MAHLKGDFWTNNQGHLKLVFPEFSDSKQVRLNTDIVCYNLDNLAPMFDLIICTETMDHLGIVLDFKTNVVTLDEQTLPIIDIKSLQDQSERYQTLASRFHLSNMFHIEQTVTQ